MNAAAQPEPAKSPQDIGVTVTLGDVTVDVAQQGNSTIFQLARGAGAARPVLLRVERLWYLHRKGDRRGVAMHRNEVLTAAEVDDGWILTCQAVPTTPTVRVVYEP